MEEDTYALGIEGRAIGGTEGLRNQVLHRDFSLEDFEGAVVAHVVGGQLYKGSLTTQHD